MPNNNKDKIKDSVFLWSEAEKDDATYQWDQDNSEWKGMLLLLIIKSEKQ